jgi:competence ComEA-like helix-hairpin-helix protein
MLADGIGAVMGRVRRLAMWGAYAAFVAIVTASWITARPASAQVPPIAPLGVPQPAAEDLAAAAAPAQAAKVAAGDPLPMHGPPRPSPAERHEDDALRHARGGLEGRLNINTATKEELVLLPGIGDAISERVLAWRERHGRFHRVVDLRRVRGIGPKTLETLRPHLTVIGPSTLRRAR